jgi:ADP-ribose pyrophosphatase YjhB (NUDIX family)
VRLEGSLDAFSLPDIFSLLSMTKKTGGLHLRRDGAHGVVWFTTGALTGGASDVTRQSLARRVVGAGVVDDAALESAVERAASEDLGVVRALQQAGAVDEGVLHDLTAEHVVDTVFDLLRWADGDFAFVVDEPNPDDIGVTRQVDDVVIEARRRLEAWGGVAATVPSPQTVLTLAPNPSDDPGLSRDEWSLLALVDGRRTVGEIVALCGRGDFAVVSALADLVTRGLLRTDDADSVSALLRRHELLGRLETAPVADVEAPGPPTDPEPVLAEDEPVEDDDEEPAAEAAVKPITSAPRPPAQRTEITPQRPEPFLPKRPVEHPEPPHPVVAAATGGGAAAAPATSTYIERDPSVNKSLLLRLIAGVRGL